MKLSFCKQKWHLNCKIWMHIPASPQKDTRKDRDLHFYVYMLLSMSMQINLGVLYDFKWSKFLCHIKSTIYCILVVKLNNLIKIVGKIKSLRSWVLHWKNNDRNASGISMILEENVKALESCLKSLLESHWTSLWATGPGPISMLTIGKS